MCKAYLYCLYETVICLHLHLHLRTARTMYRHCMPEARHPPENVYKNKKTRGQYHRTCAGSVSHITMTFVQDTFSETFLLLNRLAQYQYIFCINLFPTAWAQSGLPQRPSTRIMAVVRLWVSVGCANAYGVWPNEYERSWTVPVRQWQRADAVATICNRKRQSSGWLQRNLCWVEMLEVTTTIIFISTWYKYRKLLLYLNNTLWFSNWCAFIYVLKLIVCSFSCSWFSDLSIMENQI